MEILNKYDQYIQGALKEVELDNFTRTIVKEHFEKEQLQNKWGRILKEKNSLQELNKDSKKTNSSGNIKRFFKIGLSIAASVLVLSLCWFAIQDNSLSPYEKLLSQELNNPYAAAGIDRKGSVEELKLKAAKFYNEREYATAENYFKELKSVDLAVDWDFYIALCQLYQKQPDLAIQSFTTLLQHPNKLYTLETNWYLGVAYTMNKDFKSAEKHLKYVVSQSNDEMAWKVKEAKELLNALAEQE